MFGELDCNCSIHFDPCHTLSVQLSYQQLRNFGALTGWLHVEMSALETKTSFRTIACDGGLATANFDKECNHTHHASKHGLPMSSYILSIPYVPYNERSSVTLFQSFRKLMPYALSTVKVASSPRCRLKNSGKLDLAHSILVFHQGKYDVTVKAKDKSPGREDEILMCTEFRVDVRGDLKKRARSVVESVMGFFGWLALTNPIQYFQNALGRFFPANENVPQGSRRRETSQRNGDNTSGLWILLNPWDGCNVKCFFPPRFMELRGSKTRALFLTRRLLPRFSGIIGV